MMTWGLMDRSAALLSEGKPGTSRKARFWDSLNNYIIGTIVKISLGIE
jgi:hypothetical protein